MTASADPAPPPHRLSMAFRISNRWVRRPVPGTLTSAGAMQGLNALTGVLLARVLGAHDRGILATVTLWSGVVLLIGYLGVSEALTYYAARGVAFGRLIGTALWIWAVQSVVLACVGTGVVFIATSHLDSGTTHAALLYFVPYTPVFLLWAHALALIQGLGRFTAFNILRVLLPVVTAIIFGALAATGALTVPAALAAYLVAYTASAACEVWFIVRTRPARPQYDRQLARQLISYGARSHVTNVSSFMNLRLDQLLVSVFLPATQLGLYVVAVTITSAGPIIGSSIHAVALPTIAGTADTRERIHLTGKYFRLTLALVLIVTIPLLAVTPQVLGTFFGREFASVADVARILLIGAVFLGVSSALRGVLLAVDRPLDAGKSELMALAVTVPGLAVLIPVLGLRGAAVVSVLAYGVSAAWSARRVARAYNVSVRHILIPVRCAAIPQAAGVRAGGDS